MGMKFKLLVRYSSGEGGVRRQTLSIVKSEFISRTGASHRSKCRHSPAEAWQSKKTYCVEVWPATHIDMTWLATIPSRGANPCNFGVHVAKNIASHSCARSSTSQNGRSRRTSNSVGDYNILHIVGEFPQLDRAQAGL
jgi:hypothetical protein